MRHESLLASCVQPPAKVTLYTVRAPPINLLGKKKYIKEKIGYLIPGMNHVAHLQNMCLIAQREIERETISGSCTNQYTHLHVYELIKCLIIAVSWQIKRWALSLKLNLYRNSFISLYRIFFFFRFFCCLIGYPYVVRETVHCTCTALNRALQWSTVALWIDYWDHFLCLLKIKNSTVRMVPTFC